MSGLPVVWFSPGLSVCWLSLALAHGWVLPLGLLVRWLSLTLAHGWILPLGLLVRWLSLTLDHAQLLLSRSSLVRPLFRFPRWLFSGLEFVFLRFILGVFLPSVVDLRRN
jgi:hypothetical protein